MAHDSQGQLPLVELARLYIETLAEDARAAERPPDRPSAPVPVPRVGDLWVATGDAGDAPLLVALTWVGTDNCRGVITLDDPSLAASDDVLLGREQSPIGAPLALCAWRDVPIALLSLHTLLGPLPDSVVEPLLMALQDELTGSFVRVPLGVGRLSSGEPYVRWMIAPSEDPANGREYASGAPIISAADPRRAVRDALIAGSAYLERDALTETATIVPFASPQRPAVNGSTITYVTVRALAAARNRWATTVDNGRRFLPTGRVEIDLDNRTTVEVQERDGELWIRWLRGARVRIVGDDAPLDNRSRQLRVNDLTDLVEILQRELEWVN